jgi:hypothetical protein
MRRRCLRAIVVAVVGLTVSVSVAVLAAGAGGRAPRLRSMVRHLLGQSDMDDPVFRAGGVRKEALCFIKRQLSAWWAEHGELPVKVGQGEDVGIAAVPQISFGGLTRQQESAALRYRYLNRPGVNPAAVPPRTIIVAECPRDTSDGQWLLFADMSMTCETGPPRRVGEVLPLAP